MIRESTARQIALNRSQLKVYAARAVSTGGLSWRQLAAGVWQRIDDDDVLGRAAQLSYFMLLSLFPLLLFLSALIGLFFASERGLYSQFLGYLGRVMPYEAFHLVRETLDEITANAGGGKLTFGILFALWSASSGMDAVIEGLNVAYAVTEKRGRVRRRLVAIGLTLLLGLLVAMALLATAASSNAVLFVARELPELMPLANISSALQWSVSFLFLLIALAVIFRFGPNLRMARWEAIVPGACLTLAGWLLASGGLGLYLAYFNSYNRTYGSLGAVIILLLWLYLSGAVILIGGELNSVIWQAVLQQRRNERKPPPDPADDFTL